MPSSVSAVQAFVRAVAEEIQKRPTPGGDTSHLTQLASTACKQLDEVVAEIAALKALKPASGETKP